MVLSVVGKPVTSARGERSGVARVTGTVSDGDKGGKREPEQTGRYGSLPRRREGRGAIGWRERATRQSFCGGFIVRHRQSHVLAGRCKQHHMCFPLRN